MPDEERWQNPQDYWDEWERQRRLAEQRWGRLERLKMAVRIVLLTAGALTVGALLGALGSRLGWW